jgi:hypothetical protein
MLRISLNILSNPLILSLHSNPLYGGILVRICSRQSVFHSFLSLFCVLINDSLYVQSIDSLSSTPSFHNLREQTKALKTLKPLDQIRKAEKRKKMSRVIDLCEDSDDSEERPKTASIRPLLVSGKRAWDKEELSKDIHPRNWNGPENRNATGSADFCVDLKRADEVEESPHKKRRGVVSSIPCSKNDAAGKCAQILKGVAATEQDVGSEDTQVPYHTEYHEGIPAAASQTMNSDSEHTSRDDGSPMKHSQKSLPSQSSSNTSGRQCRVSAWEDWLSELTDYRKIHGHCNVPHNYSLGYWVGTQRKQYKLHLEEKKSLMTTFRIQELERLGFEWDIYGAAWEDRLTELADYRKIHGHCSVPQKYSENPKLGKWVTAQKFQYRLLVEGKTSPMTTFRIQALESLGFEWGSHSAAWKDRLSELAKYRKIHGHCNVPKRYSENSKLAQWVGNQRKQYRLHLEGKTSSMTPFRVQELESVGFEWDIYGTAWKDRLSELADYRRIQGHCNVPQRYSENIKLATWVATQRKQYRLHSKGKKSQMTLPRIQALESMGFEWKLAISPRKGTPKNPSLDDEARPVQKKPTNSRQGAISELETAPFNEMLRTTGYH